MDVNKQQNIVADSFLSTRKNRNDIVFSSGDGFDLFRFDLESLSPKVELNI